METFKTKFMKPREILVCLPAALLFFSLHGNAAGTVGPGTPVTLPSKEVIANMTEGQKQLLVQQIKARAEEIRAMDKSQLTADDRKRLRKEWKDMKKEARRDRKILFLSLGAVVLI